uniref:Eukaryotic translation initiation factor 4B n=1 Tax=Magallana gigas TaxID=29159 RepID=K1QDY6_MAGGI
MAAQGWDQLPKWDIIARLRYIELPKYPRFTEIPGENTEKPFKNTKMPIIMPKRLMRVPPYNPGKKKMKGKTINLTEFLSDEKGGSPAPTYSSNKIDWAAEMDSNDLEDLDLDLQRSMIDRSKLPTAPKAARGPDVDLGRIPNQPPYTAFIGNLPYEATEDLIENFFKNLKVVNVRLPTDQGRLRGFGYVEFEDRQSLIDALGLNDENMGGRKMRVDLAGQNQNENQKSGFGDRRNEGPDRTDSDWRRGPPPESEMTGVVAEVIDGEEEEDLRIGVPGDRGYGSGFRRDDRRDDGYDRPRWHLFYEPPATNAWAKGKPADLRSSESAWNNLPPKGKSEERGGFPGEGRGGSSRGGRGRGTPTRGRGGKQKVPREKPIPKSIDEMPKFEEKEKKEVLVMMKSREPRLSTDLAVRSTDLDIYDLAARLAATILNAAQPSVVVIPPNESFQDEHLLHKYLLKIKTSTSKGSSCHSLARIYIQMVGRNSSSPYFPVDVFYSGRFLFQRGCTDIFLFKVVDYLGEIDVLNFLIVKSKESSWKPVDVSAMHVASGRSWKVCHKITDIDSRVVEDGQSEDQKQRGAIGQCVQWVLKYHTWLSSTNTPIRYGAYTTRIHVLFLFWCLSVQALCVLVFYCVSPHQGSNHLPYAIFQSSVATCFLTILLGCMKFLLHELSLLCFTVEHMDQLLEHFVFKVIQSCCETIYQTPVCLHGASCLIEGNNSLSSVIQSVMEGDIARDHAVYSFSCDIIENAEMEVTLEHQFAENVYLEFTIKQAILNELRSICHSGVLLHDDETNLQEVRSSLYRKWRREGLQPKLDNRAQLAEVLLLQYVKNLNEAGLLRGSDILQNTNDFHYLQHILGRVLAIEVQKNLKFTAMSFVSKYENRQDFESDIEVQEISCIEVESDDSLTDTEIQDLREDLVPMKCFLKYVMVEKMENLHRGLPASFINKRWNFHKQFTTQAYETLTEAALILDEDSVDKSLKPKLLYELEWDMTGENRKWLPGSLMRLFALFLFTSTVFSVVYVALTAAQLTVDQVTEWFACLLVSLALYGLVWEVLLSISVGKIQERLN